jgi:hypothetical protein
VATAADIAVFMKKRLREEELLYQEVVVYEIQEQFGDDFVYDNENGNLAIKADVLEEFKKITPDVIWMRSERCWRAREDGDDPGRSQP